jgi:uncharacterized protein with PIN domain
MLCNALLERTPRERLPGRVPEGADASHDEFLVCRGCGKIYWKGTHYERMKKSIGELLDGIKLDG